MINWPAIVNRFSRQVCINLDRRPDRWRKIRRQFRRGGLDVIRFGARDGAALAVPEAWRHSRGAFGCALSHRDVVREAKASGSDSILIFEDDIELAADFADRLPRFLRAVPDDWAAIYLGATHSCEPEAAAPGVVRLTESFGTWAYALRSSHFDEVLALLEPLDRLTDDVTRILQRSHAHYCADPPLAWHLRDYSDVREAEVDRWWTREGLAVDGASVKAMTRRTGVLILPDAPGTPPPSPTVKDHTNGYLRWIFPEVRELSGPVPADAGLLARQARGFFPAGVEYLLAIEPGVLINHWPLKASLLKVRDCGMVRARYAPFPLSPDDTRKVLDNKSGLVDTGKYRRLPARRWHDGFAILPLHNEARRGTFYSPAPVLRLHSDSPR